MRHLVVFTTSGTTPVTKEYADIEVLESGWLEARYPHDEGGNIQNCIERLPPHRVRSVKSIPDDATGACEEIIKEAQRLVAERDDSDG